MSRWLLAVLALVLVAKAQFTPEQIRLGLTTNENEMVINWQTQGAANVSQVRYGTQPGNYNIVANGTQETYSFSTYTSWFINVVYLSNLQYNTTYYYIVGGIVNATYSEFSPEYNFTVQAQTHSSSSFCIGALGDMGTYAASTNVRNRMVADLNSLDLVIFAGDISYSNGDTTASPANTWDRWQRLAELVRVPWMFAPGNHESYGEVFLPYIYRFPQPNRGDFWFSFNYESTHIISLSSEHPFQVGTPQYAWLVNDLQQANTPANRSAHPFIFAMAHKPPYNSNANYQSFLDIRGAWQPLFDQYKVDLALFGHEHCYERTFPLTASTIYTQYDGSYGRELIEPNGTIYSVVGTGGNALRNNFIAKPVWSVYRDGVNYGYTKICISDANKLTWQFVTTTGSIADSFTMCRNKSLPCAIPRITRTIYPGANWYYTLTNQVTNNYKNPGFVPDASWTLARGPFGFGDSAGTTAGLIPRYGTIFPVGTTNQFYTISFTLTADQLNYISSYSVYVASDNSADVFMNGNTIDDEATRSIDHEFAYWNRQLLNLPKSHLLVGENRLSAFVRNLAASSDSYFDAALDLEFSQVSSIYWQDSDCLLNSPCQPVSPTGAIPTGTCSAFQQAASNTISIENGDFCFDINRIGSDVSNVTLNIDFSWNSPLTGVSIHSPIFSGNASVTLSTDEAARTGLVQATLDNFVAENCLLIDGNTLYSVSPNLAQKTSIGPVNAGITSIAYLPNGVLLASQGNTIGTLSNTGFFTTIATLSAPLTGLVASAQTSLTINTITSIACMPFTFECFGAANTTTSRPIIFKFGVTASNVLSVQTGVFPSASDFLSARDLISSLTVNSVFGLAINFNTIYLIAQQSYDYNVLVSVPILTPQTMTVVKRLPVPRITGLGFTPEGTLRLLTSAKAGADCCPNFFYDNIYSINPTNGDHYNGVRLNTTQVPTLACKIPSRRFCVSLNYSQPVEWTFVTASASLAWKCAALNGSTNIQEVGTIEGTGPSPSPTFSPSASPSPTASPVPTQATTGVQTTGLMTTGMQTTGDQTTGVQTTGAQTTGVDSLSSVAKCVVSVALVTLMSLLAL